MNKIVKFFLMGLFGLFFLSCRGPEKQAPTEAKVQKGFALLDAHGAIIRGDTSEKVLTLIFSADEFGEGGESIRETLKLHEIKAAFFLTGNFYQNPEFESLIHSLIADGHYLGAHSDQHLLYADWNNRDSLLISKATFVSDLAANYAKMEKFGLNRADAPFFLAPYEWYNRTIAEWCLESGIQLVNFTPGTKTPADYTYPQMNERYRSSQEIIASVLEHERLDPNGLNGFLLLVHLGTDPRREDKFYHHLDDLIQSLKGKGYRFLPIEQLLQIHP
ncbi:polysaccharide deacetylase family protein [Pararhodonellum marinum]|uniref:polysaccharide deacetylase family protein n=1 Tax=Pararhodonellum marinum TaxID=2755358 RepID=UPI00188E6D82|nr:polysaccharide deacetylase family protein [Pararhodonellum marinum]